MERQREEAGRELGHLGGPTKRPMGDKAGRHSGMRAGPSCKRDLETDVRPSSPPPVRKRIPRIGGLIFTDRFLIRD